MEFKEIKPGMVIHCPEEEDARALLEHLKNIGYSESRMPTLVWHRYYVIRENKFVGWYTEVSDGTEITEFSDLIEPDELPINSDADSPMSAKEVLEWFEKNYWDAHVMTEVFESNTNIAVIVRKFGAQGVIDKITTHEATKKAPKPVEVEYGWKCEIFRGEGDYVTVLDEKEIWECDKTTAMDEAAERARQYTVENGEQVYFRVCGICRVKEGES